MRSKHMNLNSGSYIMRRALMLGIVFWVLGTALIRLAGQYLLRQAHVVPTLRLYAISFILMALLIPRICGRLGLPRERWPMAAGMLILPTLILDPFACAFFTSVYPNLDP